jgi:hypothetical protein
MLGYSSDCGREIFVRSGIGLFNRTIASVDVVLRVWNLCFVSHVVLPWVYEGGGNTLGSGKHRQGS